MIRALFVTGVSLLILVVVLLATGANACPDRYSGRGKVNNPEVQELISSRNK